LRKDVGNFASEQYQNVIFQIGSDTVRAHAGMFDATSGSIGSVPLESGWLHWVATADGAGAMSLYKNGELINSSSGGSSVPTAIRDTNYIGIKSDLDTDFRFEGKLSEFSMWERELNSYEVQKIFEHQYSGSSVYNSYGVDSYSNSASFLPDVAGDYIIKITGTGSSAIEFATASISGAPPAPPPPSGSALACIQSEVGNVQSYFGSGFVFNNYLNLSGGRLRRTDQVPFILGVPGSLGLRRDNTISTPSGSTPTYCTGS
jgi:hypothetical protein